MYPFGSCYCDAGCWYVLKPWWIHGKPRSCSRVPFISIHWWSTKFMIPMESMDHSWDPMEFLDTFMDFHGFSWIFHGIFIGFPWSFQWWVACLPSQVARLAIRQASHGREAVTKCRTHRIHGAAIYGNMDPINIPQMLAYIPAPWILWDIRCVFDMRSSPCGLALCQKHVPYKKIWASSHFKIVLFGTIWDLNTVANALGMVYFIPCYPIATSFFHINTLISHENIPAYCIHLYPAILISLFTLW